MRRTSVVVVTLGLILASFALVRAQTEDREDDTVFRAMADELERSMVHLKMEGVDKPYYVEYRVAEGKMVNISASFGALEESSSQEARLLTPDVRVGDYTFDNTNFLSLSGLGGFGGLMGMGGPGELVVDDDYDALRHEIWLATDAAYKAAAEALAQKKAILKTQNVKDLPEDLSQENPNVYLEDPVTLELDQKAWEKRIASLSGIFRDHPEVQSSGVAFLAAIGTKRFLNSEGTRCRFVDSIFTVTVSAATQADDGMEIEQGISFRQRKIEDLPDQEKMAEKIKELAGRIQEIARAEVGEDYTGPILFEGAAATQFFIQLFLNNITDARKPLSDAGPMLDRFMPGAKLSEKIGKKVMADLFDVEDDPTLTEFDGEPLLGGYPVDEDGVAPQKIKLVEAGKLLTLPMGRIPTREVQGSNGHARAGYLMGGPKGNPSNVIIRPKEGLSEEDLKKKLIALCEEEELEYGILIRSLGKPSSGGGMSFLFGGGGGGASLDPPSLAYKVYVEDGREEPVRGLKFSDVELRALREIVAAGEKLKAVNILYGGRTLGALGGMLGSRGELMKIPVSVVAPSILVEEMDLKRLPPQTEKRPYLPRPVFEK